MNTGVPIRKRIGPAIKLPDPGPYKVELKVPMLPDLPNTRKHPRAQTAHKRDLQHSIGWEIRIVGKPDHVLKYAHVHLVRISLAEPDSDNLPASFKGVRDCLQVMQPGEGKQKAQKIPIRYRILRGDKRHQAKFTYAWEKAPSRKEQGIRILIREILNKRNEN